MIDNANMILMQGGSIAAERIRGVNDNMTKSHFHEFYELYYLESGQRYHLIQDQLYHITPGQFIIFAPYIMHHSYGEKDIPFKRLLVYFRKEELASSSLSDALEKGSGVYKLPSKAGHDVCRLLNQILEEQASPEPYRREFLQALLNSAVVITLRHKQEPVSYARKNRTTEVISYIHQHYQEDISLETLSSLFYISPYHLCREFKRFTNSTIIQYINTTRILNAQRLFLETDKNITEISRETGFSNITHFGRVFKSVTGMTPTANRKMYCSFTKNSK